MARQGRQIAFLSVCIAVAIFASYTAVIITAPSRITTWLQICSATTSAHSGLDFLAGWISAIIVTYTIKWYTRHLYDSSSNKGLYGLDHAILNIEIPPKNLWMNIGYWEREKSLPDACRALLNKVLQTAGLLDHDGQPTKLKGCQKLKLVDVGFGCGDQTIHLTRFLSRLDGETGNRRALFDSYIGITIAPVQADFAQQRLSTSVVSKESIKTETPEVHLFCADAADPTTWSPEVHEAIRSEPASVLPHYKQMERTCTWLLALDCLFHFVPSRKPIFAHAHDSLHASIIAFDLLLSESTSLVDRLLLRVICLVTSTLFSNFVTRAEYEKMLVHSGYSREDVEILDISEYVFSGISAYIQERDNELRLFGLSLGKFKVAGKIFGWWAKSRVVRGVIVVAKRPEMH